MEIIIHINSFPDLGEAVLQDEYKYMRQWGMNVSGWCMMWKDMWFTRQWFTYQIKISMVMKWTPQLGFICRRARKVVPMTTGPSSTIRGILCKVWRSISYYCGNGGWFSDRLGKLGYSNFGGKSLSPPSHLLADDGSWQPPIYSSSQYSPSTTYPLKNRRVWAVFIVGSKCIILLFVVHLL